MNSKSPSIMRKSITLFIALLLATPLTLRVSAEDAARKAENPPPAGSSTAAQSERLKDSTSAAVEHPSKEKGTTGEARSVLPTDPKPNGEPGHSAGQGKEKEKQ